MSGHEVLVRASHFESASSCDVCFEENNSIDDSSGSHIFTALSFSLTSADELGAWCTTAKSKMKFVLCL